MNFIIASNQNSQNNQTKIADSFENNFQSKKTSNNKSSFSDSLDRAQNKFLDDKVSSQDVSRKNSKSENTSVKAKRDDEAKKFDNLDSYGKNEKELSSDDNLETAKSDILHDNTLKNTSDSENSDNKKVNLHADVLELLQLGLVSEQAATNTNIDLNALIEQINVLVEQINAMDNLSTGVVEDINDLISALQEIGLSLQNVLNMPNISRVGLDNIEDVQNDLSVMTEKLNTFVRNMGNNFALVENVEHENIELLEEVKLLANQINEKVESDNVFRNTTSEEDISTTVDNNKTFVNNLEATKAQGFEAKVDKGIGEKLERNNDSQLQSSETISDEKATEFTIVKSTDGVFDMNNNLNARTNVGSSQSASNVDSSIDIMNKFQDMVSRIVERAKLTIADGKTDMIMSLRPEALGNVRMKMTVEGDSLYAKIFVDSSEVKDLFTKNLDTIISSLKELNVNIEGFDVALSQNGENAGFGDTEDNDFFVDGNNANFGATDIDINETVNIATQLYPERQLNIVI